MKNKILKSANSPRELEELFRSDQRGFVQVFPQAFAENPGSAVLQAWNERLFYSDEADSGGSTAGWQLRDIGLVVLLTLIAGTLLKLPQIFTGISEELFYMRNLAGIVSGVLIVYFCIQKDCGRRTITTILALLAAGLIYLNLLPASVEADSIILACLHMPFAFWSLLGVAYLGGAWNDRPGRMDYLRYNGELLIFGAVMVLGGMVLSGLTIELFSLIGLKIEEWYMFNIAVYGAVGIPLVATLVITRITGGRFRISPILAKVFTPLFLVMVAVYLIAMAVNQKSPFSDREFLIALNGLLVLVLGLSVFSISERKPEKSAGLFDFMNIGLVSVTLIIDLIALAAILFRLSSYGFTPNRVAVLGANLLAFCHLAGILYHYIRFTGRGSFESIEKWIVGFIPAYTAWSIFVAFVFPLIFRFS